MSDELQGGASNSAGWNDYGISREQAARIADDVMDYTARHGLGREDNGGIITPSTPRANPHLDGDGYGEGR